MTAELSHGGYLDALERKVLVYDGAMGTSLQTQDLTAKEFGGERYNGCNDYLVISHPRAVERVHRSFLDVGVDVIETDTFRANRITMQEYGLQDRILEINQAAAALARRLADEYARSTGQPRFVAGSIGPSGKLPSANDPELSNVTFDDLAEVFREQAVGLIRGGVDVLIIETSQDILEVRAAIAGCQRAFKETEIQLPIQAQVTLDTTGRMLLGTDITAALTILEGLGINVIGLNCSTGPEHMREPIRILGEKATLPVSCVPNAGLPLNVDGQAVYPMEPEPFARALIEFVERDNISVVGGCCGTTPEHLRLLVEGLGSRPRPPRPRNSEPRLSSAMSAIAMRQDPPPTLLGERCNSQGSRKFKKMLLEEDYDGILDLARDQVAGGAHALDISCAVTERPDEVELMRQVVKKLELGVDVPLVIDTTELDVMETALKTAPGRCMINSTHLESGRQKADKVFSLAKAHNAAVIVLTIDEGGMAKTREKKLEVAQRIFEIAVTDHGLRAQDLVFDTLTFTLATGDPEFANSAVETIEGIRLIKQNLPGVLASLGVSNLSFGLAPQARPVLNSVMLYHCLKAGLDMAIVNASQVRPYAEIEPQERDLAEDLIFNRRQDALQRYIEHFDSVAPLAAERSAAGPTADLSPEQRLHWCILHRHKDGIEADIDTLVNQGGFPSRHQAAVNILNNVLLPAMKEVGDKFGAGELILPFVLQSAEVMKKCVSHLERYLDKAEGVSKGIVVLATVYGDVHDIGKNLVKTILSNNGYEVVDLGKQVPAETIVTKAVEVNAAAIGLSALLVSTSKQMPLIINELHRRKLEFPVLIGGAAINRRFGRRILFAEDGSPHSGGVFYCKDAFEGLQTMDQLIVPQRREELLDRIHREAEMELGRVSSAPQKPVVASPRSRIEPRPIPHPLKWGQRIVRDMPLEIVFGHLNINELFRLSWGAKNTHGAAWDTLRLEFEARLDQMRREALREQWLQPQGVFGLFPCQADGDDLVIFDPETVNSASPDELTRFLCPRQPHDEHLSLADYFVSASSGKLDVVAIQVVTAGPKATERFDALQARANYSEAYFTHGLAVQATEAAAEYLHGHVRRELGIGPNQGKRYSWGYPAIPDLQDHRKVLDLLPAAGDQLGLSLTAACQWIPEQSTAAIVVHHKDARYYSVGESRVEQLTQ